MMSGAIWVRDRLRDAGVPGVWRRSIAEALE